MNPASLNKFLLVLTGLILITIFSFAQPVINTFSPASGAVGATLTINGSGFAATTSGNQVWFGKVKAKVLTASSSQLTVTVPAGAESQPFSITSNGLVGYAPNAFKLLFSGAANEFTRSSVRFVSNIDSVENIETTNYTSGDLDGDGKIEVITIDRNNDLLKVYRNDLVNGVPVFTPVKEMSTGRNPRFVTLGDMDGDGNNDLIISNLLSHNVSIYRNTSTPGNFTFAAPVNFTTAEQPSGICVADLDKDGRNDLVVNTVNLEGYISILKNKGNLQFEKLTDLMSVGGSIEDIQVEDVDGDGLKDIALPNFARNMITIYRNTTSGSTIQFGSKTEISTSEYPDKLILKDLNDDNKPEIFLRYYTYGNGTAVFQNSSLPGNISFSDRKDFFLQLKVGDIQVGDMNGDGKHDLIVSSFDSTFLVENTSAGGTALSFKNPVSVPIFWNGPLQIADMDLDGKNDLLYSSGIFRVSIFRNRTSETQITSISPSVAGKGKTVTINGKFLSGGTSVSFGGIPATSFTVDSDSKISAVVGEGNEGSVTINTPKGKDTITGFTYVPPPVISDFAPKVGGIGHGIFIYGENLKYVSAAFIGSKKVEVREIMDHQLLIIVDSLGEDEKILDITIETPGGSATVSGFRYLPPPIISDFTPKQAATGETITITGKNFTGVQWVIIGGVRIEPVNIISDSKIEITVPYNSSGEISVVSSNGIAKITGFVFTGPVLKSFSPAEAKTGDIITITGSNFKNIQSVKFGDVEASSFEVVSATQIKATVGEGASGVIKISATLGTAEMDGFTYYPKPSIESFNPLNANAGTSITIKGTNLLLVDSVLFGNVKARRYIIVSPTELIAIVGESPSGSVEVYTKGGKASIPGFVYQPTPVINSINPLRGAVNSTLTISGKNFDPVAANNVVYIGGQKAEVLNASATSISVKVPNSAASGQVSVTVNKLNAYSLANFTVTYPNGSSINSNSFKNRTFINAKADPANILFTDLDGDGKQDMVVASHEDYVVDVFRNTSTGSTVSFATAYVIDRKEYWRYGFVINIDDMDSDGKPDLVVMDYQSATITIFKNKSIPGQFDFEETFRMKTFIGGTFKVADLDLDGKADIIIGSAFQDNRCRLLRNSTIDGVINFEGGIELLGGISTSSISVADINNDRKPDIIMSNRDGKNISISLNESVAGLLSFAYPEFISMPNEVVALRTEDLNNDGKIDIMAAVEGSNQLLIYTNQTTGTINFANLTSFSASEDIMSITTGDINGDGKLDVVTGDARNRSIDVLENNSTTAISFRQGYTFPTYTNANSIAVVDLNGDAKPEIAATNYGGIAVTFWQNETITAIDPIPADQLGIRLFPNPNDGNFRIDGLKLNDRWETLRIIGSDGKDVHMISLKNRTFIEAQLPNLKSGIYSALLQRKDGRPVLIRFVKQ